MGQSGRELRQKAMRRRIMTECGRKNPIEIHKNILFTTKRRSSIPACGRMAVDCMRTRFYRHRHVAINLQIALSPFVEADETTTANEHMPLREEK